MLEKLEAEGIGVDDALGHRRIALAGSATKNGHVNRRRRTGYVAALEAAGLAVPQDLSVVGFDDLAIFRHIHPGLTTVRQDVMGKGSLAAQQLLRRLGGETGIEKQVTLPLTLISRGSTARLL